MPDEKEDLLAAVRAGVREPVRPVLQESERAAPRPAVPVAKPGLSRLTSSPTPASGLVRFESETDGNAPPLHIGIDLGTSRSSICASNGRRATIPTVVGWPKDPIARQFIGKDIVFGMEAIENRLSLDLCHPLRAGVIILDGEEADTAKRIRPATEAAPPSRSREAAAELLKHLVSLVQPKPGQKIYATIGTPGQVSASHRKALLDATHGSVQHVHLTTEPFAVAYSLENLRHALIVDIGAGTTDLCRVHGSIPDTPDYITLREAGDFIDHTLFNLLRQKFDKAQFTLRQIREYKERWSTVTQSAEPITVVFPVNGHPTKHDITEELRKACSSIVGPIVNAILQLVGSYDPDFQAALKSQVWLAGGGSLINGLPQAIEQGLAPLGPGVKVQRVTDPVYAGADGALKLAQTMPPAYWEATV